MFFVPASSQIEWLTFFSFGVKCNILCLRACVAISSGSCRHWGRNVWVGKGGAMRWIIQGSVLTLSGCAHFPAISAYTHRSRGCPEVGVVLLYFFVLHLHNVSICGCMEILICMLHSSSTRWYIFTFWNRFKDSETLKNGITDSFFLPCKDHNY